MIRIVIGGDVCPMGSLEQAFMKGSSEAIYHDLLGEIASADLSIVNLECPLISKPSPIVKAGPVLGADRRCIRGFSTSKWHVLNLANNHSYDHGAAGLAETMECAQQTGLKVVGAGRNLEEANTPLIQCINGQRIVIYAMAEREFSLADDNVGGANPLDLINFVHAINSYKKNGFFLLLIHGGQEYYPYPTPQMVRRCRFMIEMGADAVICCHEHCPLPWEIYLNRPIIYGLGNLVFDPQVEPPPGWYDGYLARLTIQDRQVAFNPIPYYQSRDHQGTFKMSGELLTSFLFEMENKNVLIKNKTFVEDQWIQHCRRKKDIYMSNLFGFNVFMRKFRRLLLRTTHSRKSQMQALHLVQCETHQETLSTIFRDLRNGPIFLDHSS